MKAAGLIKPIDWTASGVNKHDIQIPTRDEKNIRAVVYNRREAVNSQLVVYFHGGGWTFGWPELWENGTSVLVHKLGCTVVSVDYRLAPENPWPTAANDACDSLTWCAENAASLGADASKGFIVAGTSAGGNLAAIAVHDAIDKQLEPKVTGVMLMCAALIQAEAVPDEWKPHYNSHEEHKDGMVLDGRGMNWFIGESILTSAYRRDS